MGYLRVRQDLVTEQQNRYIHIYPCMYVWVYVCVCVCVSTYTSFHYTTEENSTKLEFLKATENPKFTLSYQKINKQKNLYPYNATMMGGGKSIKCAKTFQTMNMSL